MDDIEPQPKPRQRRKDARPAEILAAGLAEFALHGFAATRLADVAARAGIAKGTIYRYFTDKETLFTAAIEARLAPLFDNFDVDFEASPQTSRALITTMITALHGALAEADMPILIRILLAEGRNFPALNALYHQTIITRGRSLLGRIVARGIARGEIRPGPAADLALVVISPLLMAAIWRSTFDAIDPIPADAFRAAHIDLVLNGLCLPETI